MLPCLALPKNRMGLILRFHTLMRAMFESKGARKTSKYIEEKLYFAP